MLTFALAHVGEANILEWWHVVVRPIISGTGYKKPVLEDARAFLLGVMVREEGDDGSDDNIHKQARISSTLCDELLGIYIARSRGITEQDQFVAPENAQVAQQMEDALFAFGRKRPKDLFHSLDDLVNSAGTRLQALTLLSSFLRLETPHLYLVIHTPLVEHLLKCLMNDTSTTVLSVALTSLIMLLPHIPGSLGPHLPRLFLIYSRLLCWEKFSSLSSDAQKNLVTDDRVPNEVEDGKDPGDIGIDPTWEKVRPPDGVIESSTPELMTYFTYLYGLYPLNFTNYIRKPRRYLKNLDFPGADDFDLDQAVIRNRTEQYRQAHLLHPNFFNKTAEEELIDPKWPKMDPADVVGECHGLCLNSRPTLAAPGPPPTSKLPDIPPIPPLSATSMKFSGQPSPSLSHASFRSGSSWRDTQSTAVAVSVPGGDSPVLKPEATQSGEDSSTDQRPRSKASNNGIKPSPSFDDYSQAGTSPSTAQRVGTNEKPELPQTNLAYLQLQITLLRNDLNFERWHKAQYSQHISQIMRRNVKEATVEAETLNLIQANRALKKQLDQVRKAREATVKDSALTRKQANSLESNMTERFHKLRLEQETWQADADELRRLRSETKQYRELLVATEARELNKSHQLELVQQDLEKLQDVQTELRRAQRKLHEYEYKDFEYQTASRQRDIFRDEKEDLQMRIQQHEQIRERMRQAYAGKVSELEAQLAVHGGGPRTPSVISSHDSQILIQQAVADSESRLTQLRKVHGRLLEKFTELELEYQSVRSQLESHEGRSVEQSSFYQDDGEHSAYGHRHRFSTGHGYDGIGEYYAPSEAGNTIASSSDPTSRRFQPPMQGLPVTQYSQSSVHRSAGLTFDGSTGRKNSLASGSSTGPAAFNQSAPLGQDEMSVVSGTSSGKKEKIQPDSTVRVYGRGMSQR